MPAMKNPSGRRTTRKPAAKAAPKAFVAKAMARPVRPAKEAPRGMTVRAGTPAGAKATKTPGRAVLKGPVAPGPRQTAGPRTAAQKGLPARRPGKADGLDIGKFAGEVSRNYARGVARVGKEVDNSVDWGKKGIAGAERFIRNGGIVGKTGIPGAMDNGFKDNNLKKILRGTKTKP